MSVKVWRGQPTTLDGIPNAQLNRLMQMGFDRKVQAGVRWMF